MPWRHLRQGKVDPRHQAQGRGPLAWRGPVRALDCWRSSQGCWPGQGPDRGHCSWHWGPRHSGGAGDSYLGVRTGRRHGHPAGRRRGVQGPPALGEGSWVELTAGGRTGTPACCAAWREGNLGPGSWLPGRNEDQRLIREQRPEGSAESLVHWWGGTAALTATGCQTQRGRARGRGRAQCEPEGEGGARREGRKENGPESPGHHERCRRPTPPN